MLILELLLCKISSSIYQLSSDFVKQLFRIQMQKGKKVLLWNQVKSRMEDYYSELVLVGFPRFNELLCIAKRQVKLSK